MSSLACLAIILPAFLDDSVEDSARLVESCSELAAFWQKPMDNRTQGKMPLSQGAHSNERLNDVLLADVEPFLVGT